jgi:hypothetical protein
MKFSNVIVLNDLLSRSMDSSFPIDLDGRDREFWHGHALVCDKSCIQHCPTSFDRPRSDSHTGVRSSSQAYLGSRFPCHYIFFRPIFPSDEVILEALTGPNRPWDDLHLTIKDEVQKLLKDGFIYPIQLTQWVSNPIPVNKKKGTIFMCMDFLDFNKAYLKDNFPTPFIDQIVDECAGCEVFSFMDGFSGYNQIQNNLKDQHKTTFIYLWGTFPYHKIPSGLNNDRATFQRAMYFCFHDLIHIFEAYLDDIASHSRKISDHPTHL